MSDNFEKLIAAFTRHLEVKRSLSVHTIRAYLGDLESLLAHLEAIGVTDISQLELVHLRSWLANQQIKGGARTTLSRRAVSVRLFTKWAVKNKYLAKDVAATLATPKGHRTLPDVLEIADAKVAMDSLATRAAEEETPISLRDVAMMFSNGTSNVPSGCTRKAVAGARSISARIASPVRARARSSSTWPRKTKVMMTAEASKYVSTPIAP